MKELLQQALDDEFGVTSKALRAEIEAYLAAPQPEPVHQFRALGCSDWYDGHPDRTINGPYETRTLYATPPAASANMVMVPREPTPDMARAGWALLPSGPKDVWDAGLVKGKAVYRAMIAAAPAPAVREPQDERAAFEAWARSQDLQSGYDGTFDYPLGNILWKTWQARAARGIGGGGK